VAIAPNGAADRIHGGTSGAYADVDRTGQAARTGQGNDASFHTR
jgi:hypothetical protein